MSEKVCPYLLLTDINVTLAAQKTSSTTEVFSGWDQVKNWHVAETDHQIRPMNLWDNLLKRTVWGSFIDVLETTPDDHQSVSELSPTPSYHQMCMTLKTTVTTVFGAKGFSNNKEPSNDINNVNFQMKKPNSVNCLGHCGRTSTCCHWLLTLFCCCQWPEGLKQSRNFPTWVQKGFLILFLLHPAIDWFKKQYFSVLTTTAAA